MLEVPHRLRLPETCYARGCRCVEAQLPHRLSATGAGFGLWVCGAILAGAAPARSVASATLAIGQMVSSLATDQHEPMPGRHATGSVPGWVYPSASRPGSAGTWPGDSAQLAMAVEPSKAYQTHRRLRHQRKVGTGDAAIPTWPRAYHDAPAWYNGVWRGPNSGTAAGLVPRGPRGNDRDKVLCAAGGRPGRRR